jgi:hypothetical protein
VPWLLDLNQMRTVVRGSSAAVCLLGGIQSEAELSIFGPGVATCAVIAMATASLFVPESPAPDVMPEQGSMTSTFYERILEATFSAAGEQ